MSANMQDTMWKWLSIVCSAFAWMNVSAQTWQWTALSPMPIATSNNAVCEAIVGSSELLFSFGGIDSTKLYSGIHKRCFRYEVLTDTWIEIDTLPTTLPRIAMGASYVKDKIYVIGGYHVFQNGNEISSDEVHIFNPQTNLFEGQGSPVPYPIDDQVQCVWRDSLIFVVTGWSNTGNVPYVQIYDPMLDTWQAGTYTPNNAYFTAFGASGYIVGDTLYYAGGAGGSSFAARKYMRKGLINPLDPTDITWLQMEDVPGEPLYRSACSASENTVFWVGGASVSYNYNGIAYNGSGGVSPSARVLHFNNLSYSFADENAQPYGVMDLRGIGKFPNNRWIICGGMDSVQAVRSHTFLIENASVKLCEFDEDLWVIEYLDGAVKIVFKETSTSELFDMKGRLLNTFEPSTYQLICRSDFPAGVYLFSVAGRTFRIVLE